MILSTCVTQGPLLETSPLSAGYVFLRLVPKAAGMPHSMRSCTLNALLECYAHAQIDCFASITRDWCRIHLIPPNTGFKLLKHMTAQQYDPADSSCFLHFLAHSFNYSHINKQCLADTMQRLMCSISALYLPFVLIQSLTKSTLRTD